MSTTTTPRVARSLFPDGVPIDLPPPNPKPVSETTVDQSAILDAQIAAVKKQIAALTLHKQQLATVILAQAQAQPYLDASASEHSEELKTFSSRAQLAQVAKIASLTYGVTTFPHYQDVDTSSSERNPPLLGVRIHVPSPLSKSSNDSESLEASYHSQSHYDLIIEPLHDSKTTYLKLVSHSLPPHIDISPHLEKHLPLPSDVEEGNAYSDDSLLEHMNSVTSAQDLSAFITSVRDDLLSWRHRVHSIEYIRSKLGLIDQPNLPNNHSTSVLTTTTTLTNPNMYMVSTTTTTPARNSGRKRKRTPRASLLDTFLNRTQQSDTILDEDGHPLVEDLFQANDEATKISIGWHDGSVGSIDLDEEAGIVNVAVATRDGDRMASVEKALGAERAAISGALGGGDRGGRAKVLDLPERLKSVEAKMRE